MTCRVIIYTASGRTLSENHSSVDECADAMQKVRSCMRSGEPFMFGRSLINPCCIEAAFTVSSDGEYHDDESRRLDMAPAMDAAGNAPADLPGVFADGECPPGYVEAHAIEGFHFDVEEFGTFDDIHSDGRAVLYWNEPKPFGKDTLHSGVARINGNYVVKMTFLDTGDNRRWSSFKIYPSKVYIDPSRYRTKAEAERILIDRARIVASVLEEESGWKFIVPQVTRNIELDLQRNSLTSGARIVYSSEDELEEAMDDDVE